MQSSFCISSIKVDSWSFMMQMMMQETDILSGSLTVRVRNAARVPPNLIVLLQDGGWSVDAISLHQLRLSSLSSAALRPHLLLRMSDRTAASYDQTLLSLCTCDSSLREALMCCQQCSPLSCLDLPSPSVSVQQL